MLKHHKGERSQGPSMFRTVAPIAIAMTAGQLTSTQAAAICIGILVYAGFVDWLSVR